MQSRWPIPAWFDLPYREALAFYLTFLESAGPAAEAQRLHKKTIAEADLFYLLVFVLNRKDINREWLFDRCREFQAAPDGHLDLWAREHYKSTIITFGGTIFEFIQDVEMTACIFSHTKGIARDFLTQIKMEMEQNGELHYLWPDVFWSNPAKEAPSWSVDGGLILNRKSNPKEKSLEAHGLVDGQPTGRHFRLKIYDDVVTLESVNTPDQIAKTTHAFRMSDNLGAEGGHDRYIGTRYHMFDTYRTMMDEGIAIPRIHPATHDGTEHGIPVLLSKATLALKRLKQGIYVFASQMLLNPTADKAMGFNEKWLRYGDTEYATAMRALWRFIIVDPAGSKQRKNNDYTTMLVIGYGADEQYRVLDMRRDRMNLATRWSTLLYLHQHWKPGLVAYEEYGMQADIEHFQREMKRDLYEFDITTVGGNMPKPLRILRLIPHFENGWKEGDDGKAKIILPTTCTQVDYQGHAHDLVKDFVEQEYTAFPVMAHDDMFDCLARIVDLEEAKAIQKPSIVATPAVGLKIQDALNKINRGNTGSWETA